MFAFVVSRLVSSVLCKESG